MSEIWPFDVWNKESLSPRDSSKSFKCLLLMPFEKRFDQVAEVIQKLVEERVKSFPSLLTPAEPIVERVDWVDSTGVIQQDIWKRIIESDLIFCDITGYNPNVMFECGVCTGWKKIHNIVFIKDRFFKQEWAFNLASFRTFEYEMTSDGMERLNKVLRGLVWQALIEYPDGQGESPKISLPLEIDFERNRDTSLIYTPPFAHRRMIEDRLEFGSSQNFNSSWATIGKERFNHFHLEFQAKFSNVRDEKEAWIGVGLHSQHCSPGLAHIFYLRSNGMIIMAEPNENPPKFYEDKILNDQRQMDTKKDHTFRIYFDRNILNVEADDFLSHFEIDQMPKVLPAGLIRFQSYRCWMALRKVKLKQVDRM